MPKCVFCGNEKEAFKGTHRITNDGETSYFCGSKCMTNALKLKRDKRKIRWTEAFHETRAKRSERSSGMNNQGQSKVVHEKAKERVKEKEGKSAEKNEGGKK